MIPSLIRSFLSIFLLIQLYGCGGSATEDQELPLQSDPIQTESAQTDSNPADTQVLQDEPLVCEAPPFDTAELLFTEIDRQWTCSIEADTGTRFGDVFFSRNGRVEFSAEGVRFWNRDLVNDAINIVAVSGEAAVIRNIRSSNTVLDFELTTDTGTLEAYGCVLVARSVPAL